MLMEILKFVDTRSLFKSRGVNRQWCFISSEILSQRPETEIKFDFSAPRGFTNGKRGKLKDFVDCSKGSIKWPYARLSIAEDCFELPSSKYFHYDEWTQFLSDYDISSIKFLKLQFPYLNDDDDPIDIWIQKIGDLLLNKLPHLEEFELLLSLGDEGSKTKLFPTEKNYMVQHGGSFQLPHLKAIHFGEFMLRYYPQISKDLLNAAVNLKKIYVAEYPPGFSPESFEFLHSQEKLDLVQTAEIQLSEGFISTVKKYTGPRFTFKLKELKLTMADSSDFDCPRPNSWEAERFLSRLFETSQHSLRKLCMGPIGVLDGLQFPRFKNLTELKLENHYSPDPFFPPGIRALDIFPAVNRLDLELLNEWRSGFPTEDSIPRLSSVKILRVTNRGITRNKIAVLALLCPNLQDFQIKRVVHPPRNFVQVGRAIWTHMKQLESLELDIDAGSTQNGLAALSSCFTGISEKHCRRLYEMKKAAGTLKRHGVPVKIPKSKLKVVREYPSILDMKDLRKLAVNSYLNGKPLGKQGFSNKVTWLTQEYALNHMPHLEINGVKAATIK